MRELEGAGQLDAIIRQDSEILCKSRRFCSWGRNCDEEMSKSQEGSDFSFGKSKRMLTLHLKHILRFHIHIDFPFKFEQEMVRYRLGTLDIFQNFPWDPSKRQTIGQLSKYSFMLEKSKTG